MQIGKFGSDALSIPTHPRRTLRSCGQLGAELDFVSPKDANGRYLDNRITALQSYLAEDKNAVWHNQYAEPAGPFAHYKTTAAEFNRAYRDIDYLFVGAGSTGTLMGCAQYFRENKPNVRVIAVDVGGSIIFLDESKSRPILGLGPSKRPAIIDASILHDIAHVDEPSSTHMCRKLDKNCGVLFGGSTGSILAGIVAYAAKPAAAEPSSRASIYSIQSEDAWNIALPICTLNSPPPSFADILRLSSFS